MHYATFGQNPSIHSENIERKRNSDAYQGSSRTLTLL